ncbi:hypothetical protein BDB01DRAFT_847727 [Pilobolus umbonatus]|nr:hypothetical protein BDB01DRAFT_847727 [Pilobolus umbonatus]
MADYNTQVPPPSYQQTTGGPTNKAPGATYYQPPPPPEANYPPPPVNNQPPFRGRIVQFYSPPENRGLAMKRRLGSFFCCILIAALVIGLAAGLTRRNYSNRCDCRSNSDCIYRYG